MAASLGMFALTRRTEQDPAELLDRGLVYEVGMGFLIAVTYHCWPAPPGQVPKGWSPVAVWLVAFALLVPATRGKNALATVATALMDPLGLMVSVRAREPGPERARRDEHVPADRRRGRRRDRGLARRERAVRAGRPRAGARELPARRASRPRRHGRSVARRAPHARARRRDQARARRHGRVGPRDDGALRARGEGHGRAPLAAHDPALRLRALGRRRVLLRHGAPRRLHARGRSSAASGRFRRGASCTSSGRSATRSPRRTRRASSTATSSPATSSSAATAAIPIS